MCKKLYITRSAYYKWLNRETPEKELKDIKLGKIVNEYNEKYGGILGYRRMTMFINRNENKDYKYKRVRKCCTVSNKNDEKADNILNRNFEASKPNEKWTTDVCEFKIPKSDKKLYLSVFIDLYDRSIVSWQISYQNNNILVFETFDKAIEANPNAQLLFHSDRGFQYTSPAFKNKLEKQGIQQSMSRVACCLDNAVSEGLWGIFREEMYKLYDIYDEESLISAIENYINFYNNHRYQERYDSKSPMEIRLEALQSDTPKFYPIPVNKRIEKYKASLALKNPTEITSIGQI